MTPATLAFDRTTARSIDAQGFLHVSETNISKATVNPYLGMEIPDYQSLGLDPMRVYMVLRPPEELEKAASTFNNLPVLDEHVEVSVVDFEDPEIKQHVVGSTGTDAVFRAPYLQNSMVIWTESAIRGIETREKTELSCAYRYNIEMNPGVYEGMPYDGVMRNIRGNHVALVVEGRAGHDVVVKDSAMASQDAQNPALSIIEKLTSIKGEISDGLKSGASEEKGKILDDCTASLDVAIHHLLDLMEESKGSEDAAIQKREDVKPQEGEEKYGEVLFADPKNKKYPIDTPDHIRAALTYWGRTRNRNKYSEEDQATITKRIEEAAKKHKIGQYAETGKDSTMPKKLTTSGKLVSAALTTKLASRLAADKALQPGEILGVLSTIEPAPFDKQRSLIVSAVKDAFKDRLAADQNLEDLDDSMDAAEEEMEEEPTEDCKLTSDMEGEEAEEKIEGNVSKMLEDELGKLEIPAEAKGRIMKMVRALGHTGEETAGKEDKEMGKDSQTIKPEDIQKTVIEQIRATTTAQNEVRPVIGDVVGDSAEAVYKLALDHLKVNVEGIHPSAYRALFQAHAARHDEKPTTRPSTAADSNNLAAFYEKYPAAKLQIRG